MESLLYLHFLYLKCSSGAFRGIFIHFLHPQYKINKRVFMVLLFLSVKHWGSHAGPLWHFLCSRGASDYRKPPLTAFVISWLEMNSHHLDSIKRCVHFLRLQQFICHLTKDDLPFFHLIYFPDKEFPAKRSVASESAFLCWGQCSNNRL